MAGRAGDCGMERTLRVVRQHQRQTPGEIFTALFAAVGDFGNNNYRDDLTAVRIKVDGAADPKPPATAEANNDIGRRGRP